MLSVVEVGGGRAGQFAGMYLAELGATVVRLVESAMPSDRFATAYFDRGKTISEVDLTEQRGIDQLLEHIEAADVVIDTFMPGRWAQLGIAIEQLLNDAPHLVFVSVSPFGQDGPHANWKATELVVQAAAGLLASSGNNASPPARLAGDQASHVSGVFAATQALAAIAGIRRGQGSGVHLDISMQEVMATHWAREIGRYVYTGEGLSRADPGLGIQGFPHTVPCGDGFIFLLALRATWEDLASFIGLDQYVGPEWSDAADRTARWSEMEADFLGAFATKGRYEWFASAAERGYTFAPVDDALSILESAQLRDRGYFQGVFVDGEVGQAPSLPFRWGTE